MIKDQFLAAYSKKLDEVVEGFKEDLLSLNAENLYQLGKIQGSANGLKMAKAILEAMFEEQDT